MAGTAVNSPWPSPTGESSFAKDPTFRAGRGGKRKADVATEVIDQRRADGQPIPRLHLVSRAERLRREVLASRWGNPYSKPGSA